MDQECTENDQGPPHPKAEVAGQPRYDVAISFLSRDEPIALEVLAKLSPQLSVFVYSKAQEELAGTDGLESLRESFLLNASLVTVLYRDGWGQTPWTRIEESAIKDKCLQEGWDRLLFVSLDESSTPPTWLPRTELRLNLPEYGIEQLVGAAKMRVQSLGGQIRRETVLDRARRVEASIQQEEQRQRRLGSDGRRAARDEAQYVFRFVKDRVAEVNSETDTLKIRAGYEGNECGLRTESVGVTLILGQGYDHASMTVREWLGPPILPDERQSRIYLTAEPRHLLDHRFLFDYREWCGWCWKAEGEADATVRSCELAEFAVNTLLNLQERVLSGELRVPSDLE